MVGAGPSAMDGFGRGVLSHQVQLRRTCPAGAACGRALLRGIGGELTGPGLDSCLCVRRQMLVPFDDVDVN